MDSIHAIQIYEEIGHEDYKARGVEIWDKARRERTWVQGKGWLFAGSVKI